jgi:hypothetical protein
VYVIDAVLCSTRGAKGVCMKAGIKMQLTWGRDEPTTATERSVLNNFI